MKKSCIAMTLLSTFLFVSGCGNGINQTPDSQMQAINTKFDNSKSDDASSTCYEVFVRSFWDSNEDGIGDIKGLTEKLDYINDGNPKTREDLGCDSIWLMPICPSPSYHKYDVTDYMDIDPEYGTMEDFDAFVSEAHKRNVSVILDTVLNHTSDAHPWFVKAKEYLQNTKPEDIDVAACPEVDYYHFTTDKQDGYEPLAGTPYYYEARFWSGMPDLNLDNEKVREEIKSVIAFWTEHGADGFRLDAVTSYYTGDNTKNIEFLTFVQSVAKSCNPDAYLVGECWANSSTYSKYYASGVDSFFDFDFADGSGIIADVTRGSGKISKYGYACEKIGENIQENGYPYAVDAPFYTNHDMNRSAGYYLKDDGRKVKFAQGLNLLMSGRAFLYYGEELGMKGSGKDENKRAPMYWSKETQTGICTPPPNMDQFEMKFDSLEEQKKDPYSIYEYVRQAITLRQTHPAIRSGSCTYVEKISGGKLCVLIKKTDNEQVMIVINSGNEPLSTSLSDVMDTPEKAYISGVLQVDEQEILFEDSTITLPPYGIAVISDF